MLFMNKEFEFCLICEGFYRDEIEARHALQDPFIEEYVEDTGKFRFHNLENIRVTGGISLADLEIAELDEGVFEVSCRNSQIILKKHKAEKLAEVIRLQAIFDEIRVEPIKR
jgi:hypothetical protein